MSKKTKFVLNRIGVRELMQSTEMQMVLNERASQAVQRLGAGYASDSYVGKTRANAMVYADSFDAKLENLRNNSILKAVK